MKKRKKIKGRILTLLLSLAMLLPMIPTYAFAEEIDGMPGARSEYNASTGDVFLGGNYIEVGISKHGSFGTSTLPITNQNWHPHSSASGLGLTSDGDGWDVGETPVTGDFFLPGSPEERWGFAYKLDDVVYQYLVADRQSVFSGEWSIEPTVKDESDVSKGVLKAVVSGKTIHDVELTITYSFGVDDKFYTTRVEIANKSANEISDVRFLRSFDPDQDQQTKGVYDTYNKVICNPISDKAGSSENFAMVVARGSKTMAGFFFLSFDNRARASRGVAFGPNSLYLPGLWDNAPTTNLTYADENEIALTQEMVGEGKTNSYLLEDSAIAITCHIGNIAATTGDSIEFISSLDPNVQEALSGILNAQVDYKNERLTGLEPSKTYEIACNNENEKYTLTADERGEIPLQGVDTNGKQYDFIGKKLTIAKKDSEDAPAEVEVAGRPETPKNPSDLGNEGESTPALDADIEIVKLTSTSVTISPAEGQQYVYSTDDGTSWNDITDTDNDGNYVIDNLQEGAAVKIRTRVAATSQAPASEWSDPTDVTLMTTVSVSATGWSGIYDKNAHSITVTATQPAEGVTITYSSEADGKYSKTNPSFYSSGEYVVYYRAVADGCYPDYGSATINIDKKEITVSGVRVDKNNTLKKAVFSGLLSGDELANDIDYEIYDFSIGTEAGNPTASVKVRLKDTQSANNYKLSVGTISNIPVTVEADPIPSKPTVPTENYTVPVKNENTVHVDAQIKEGSAVISEITPETLDKVAAGSTGSGVDTVTIDLSGAKQEVTGITLSKKSIETLAQAAADKDNPISTVTIEMTGATVVLDADTLKTLAQDAKGTDIRLVVEDTEHKNLNTTQQTALKNHQVAATFEAYFVSGGQRIHDFKGGSAVVSVEFTPQAGKDANYYHMVYVSDDGKLTRYKTKYENGMLMFTAMHFSDYAIIYDETEKNDTEQAQLTDAEKIQALKGFKLVARSKMSWLGNDRSVRVRWFDKNGKDLGDFGFDGYEIWRSVKRNTGYGKKPFFVTKKEFYHNDRIEAGKKYYYRVRGYITVDGKKYYTDWSLKAWRTVDKNETMNR